MPESQSLESFNSKLSYDQEALNTLKLCGSFYYRFLCLFLNVYVYLYVYIGHKIVCWNRLKLLIAISTIAFICNVNGIISIQTYLYSEKISIGAPLLGCMLEN